MLIFIGLVVLCVCFVGVYITSRLDKYWLLAPSTTMLAYFLLVMLPGIYLVSNDLVVLRALLAYLIWFSGVFLGGWLAWALAWKRSYIYKAHYQGNEAVFLFFVVLAIPCVLFTFYMLGRIPLFLGLESLFGGGADLSMHAARRMNTFQHHSGDTVYFGQGYLRQIYTVVSPVFWVALYFSYKTGARRVSGVVVYSLMAFLIISAALNGQIWVVAQLIVFFAMAKYFVLISRDSGASGYAVVLRGVIAYLGLLTFVFAYRYFQSLEGRVFVDFFGSTLRRIYSPGAVELFGVFPELNDFRYGATWVNDLRGMLPGSVQSFAYEVHYLVHGGGWGYTLSPGVVASSYVNFGYVGVFFVGVFVSFVFSFAFYRMLGSSSSLVFSLAIYLSYSFMFSMPGDVVIYAVSLLTSFLIYISYVFLNSFVRQVLSGRRPPV